MSAIESFEQRKNADLLLLSCVKETGEGRSFELQDISLRVPVGSIYGFLGPNGSAVVEYPVPINPGDGDMAGHYATRSVLTS